MKILAISTGVLLLTGCQGSDQQDLHSALQRYAELSTRAASANWPVEFGEVLVSDALTAAEAGFLLLADAEVSQVGQVSFADTEILAAGSAQTCLDLSQSRLLFKSGEELPSQPNQQVQLSYQRLAGVLKISSFELAGATC